MALDSAGRRALHTRLLIGPTLIAVIAGVYVLDRRATHGVASSIVVGLLAIGGLWEYITMMRGAGFPVGRRYLLVAGVALHSLPPFFDSWQAVDSEIYPPILITVVLVFVMSVRALARSRMDKGLEELGSTLLGLVLVSWPMYLAQGLALRAVQALFFVVLVAKSGDIGGYFSGILLGRKKLIPHISPGKSVEGALGSFVFSCVIAALLSGPFLSGVWDVGPLVAIALGAMINLTAQLGDLVESLLKRRCGVKDSSAMLPEHGGILDLTDSLLFTVPAFFFVLVRFT